MKDRKQYRKAQILVKVINAFGKFSDVQRKQIQSTSDELVQNYSYIRTDIDLQQIEDRRIRLRKNEDLRNIFEMFWVTLNPYCQDGVLSKEGYLKCNIAVSSVSFDAHMDVIYIYILDMLFLLSRIGATGVG